jgi:hypothetical protein
MAQEEGNRLVVHIRSNAVTVNHGALKNEALNRDVAASLEKVAGVSRTRAIPTSAVVEARFDSNKTTGQQIANAAQKILQEKLPGRKIVPQKLPSNKASSKIVVNPLGNNRVQLTSDRFY